MDQEIDAQGEVEAGRPPRFFGKLPRAERRFMVGQVGNPRPVGRDAVADRWSGVDDMLGNNLETTDGHWLLGRVVQHDASVEVANPDRKSGGER